MDSAPDQSEEADRSIERVGMLVDGKWQIERVLGIGGMATVYYAVHQHTNRRTAIKVLHQQYCHTEEVRGRFAQEGKAANRVNHRGAVPVLDDGVLRDGTPYMVMDFLDGQSLQARWEKCNRAMSVEEVFLIAERLLDILEAAHQAGVLHRDIKPENVYLTNEGEVKLLDFGISKMSGETQSHKTQVGSTMGTPAFMCPEQARGRWEEIDGRADIFAVGATMYAMLSGRAIHEADTTNELLLKVMTQPAADLMKVAPHVPAFAARVVNRAVSFDKKNRYESAAKMRGAVRAINARFNRGLKSLLGDEDLTKTWAGEAALLTTDRSTHRPVSFSPIQNLTRFSPAYMTGRQKAMVAGGGALVAAFLMTLFIGGSSGAEDLDSTEISQATAPATPDPNPTVGEPVFEPPKKDGPQTVELGDLPEDSESVDAKKKADAKKSSGDRKDARAPTSVRPVRKAVPPPAPEPDLSESIDIPVDPLARRR